MATGGHLHQFRSTEEAAFARSHLERLAAQSLTPPIIRWEPGIGSHGGVVQATGTPLTDWLTSANPEVVAATRPKVLALVHGIHAQGICHRDLHIENVVLVSGRPMAIDFEHAIEVDPEWPCYDLSGPSECVPLLPAHAEWSGVLGTYGISWDGPLDERWSGRYVPLGMIFGPVSADQPS